MIFINEAKKEIGDDCLLFDYKTKKFYGNLDVQSTDIDRLYSLLQQKVNLNISKEIRDKLLLVVLYSKMEKDENAKKIYVENFLQYNPYNAPENDDTLHILFNIIEIENKYKISSKDRLMSLEKYLEQRQRDSDDDIGNFLLKFYLALLNYLLGNQDSSKFDITNKIITGLIGDINDEMANLVTTDRIKYIQIRLHIMKYQLLEQEGLDKNKKDILDELQDLFGLIKLQQESFATKIGIKLYSIQAQYGMYTDCIGTLEQLLTVVSRQKLLGKSNMGIIEQSLYIVGLLGYYNSLTGNFAEVRRFIKKINKTLKILNEKYSSGNNFGEKTQYEKRIKEEIIPQYEFYKNMLETIVNGNDTSMRDALRKTFIDFQSFISKNNNSSDTSMEDSAILNMHILQIPGASLKESFREKEKNYKECLDSKKEVDNNHILPFYMYNYNVIVELFKNINNNTERIRTFCKKILDYTESISNKDYTKELLRLPYFKEMLNTIIFMRIYTYFYEKDYKNVIKYVEEYLNMTSFSYELDVHNDSYCKILKLRGDAYFQCDQYMKAIQFYEEVLGKNPNFNSSVLLINLGLSYLAVGQKDKARNYFEYAQSYNLNNKIKEDEAMVSNDYLDELLKKC